MSLNPLKPFLPAWFDEAELPAPEFRVLCHLWRRADRAGESFPGVQSVARKCRLDEGTVWSALKQLEERGMLKRTQRPGRSNLYQVLIPSEVTLPFRVTTHPAVSGDQARGKTGRHPLDFAGQGVTGKGRVRRVSKEGNPFEGVNGGPPTWPLALPESQASEIADVHGLSDAQVLKAYQAFRDRKLGFRDAAPADSADVWAAFRGWLAESGPGEELIASFRTDATRRRRDQPVVVAEPDGWLEWMKENRPDWSRLEHGATWGQMDRSEREYIAHEMQKPMGSLKKESAA